MLREVQRIAAASPEEILRTFVPAREPVVIEGFLRGTPLEDVSTLVQARVQLGDVPLELREEFVSWSLRHGGAADRRPSRQCTLAQYLSLLDAEPSTPWMCTEHPTPDPLVARMGPAPRALAGGAPLVSFSFVGGRGHHAHLHYDGDFRNVLLVQVFGQKRAVLVEPAASHFVLPVGNFSGVFIDRLEGKARGAFLDLVDAWTAEIGPGDALFMPAAIWHFLEYPDTGMSINLRFGASDVNAKLAGRFHPHSSLQRLAWHFADAHAPSAKEEEGVGRLLALAQTPSSNTRATGAAVEEMSGRLANEWCGAASVSPFVGNSDALGEAATLYESARLYPAARASLAEVLSGWGTAGR